VVFALANTAGFDGMPPSLTTKITGLWLWRKWSIALAPSLGNEPSHHEQLVTTVCETVIAPSRVPVVFWDPALKVKQLGMPQ
jgi:hypothetical protein